MAGATLDWADKPNADLSMSSDEEESASSQSAEMELELDSGAKPDLALELGKLQLKHEDANQAAEQESPLTPRPSQTPLQPKAAQPLQLLELPLDVLKEIIKEVKPGLLSISISLSLAATRQLTISA